MSYDINLVDPVSKEVLQVENPHFMRGGTYRVGGSSELSLNMTYNYSVHLHKVLTPSTTPSEDKTGVRSLYGMTALEAIPHLERAVSQLSDDVSSDYWEPTEGNVKLALTQLLTMCRMRPDAFIQGD